MRDFQLLKAAAFEPAEMGSGALYARAIPFSGERLYDYVERLTALFGATSINSFLKFFMPGVTLRQLRDGDAQAEVAALVGLPADIFETSTIRRGSNGRRVFNQEEFSGKWLRSKARCCLRCLDEDLRRMPGRSDLRAHIRQIWYLRPFRFCPVHGDELVELEEGFDWLRNAREKHKPLRFWASAGALYQSCQQVDDAAIQFARFLASRFEPAAFRPEAPPLLQGLTAEQSLLICEATGKFVRLASAPQSILAATDPAELQGMGFELLSADRDRLKAAVRDKATGLGSVGRLPRLADVIGPDLYRGAVSLDANLPIRNYLRHLGVEYTDVSERQSLFRGCSNDRGRHSIAQYSRILGEPVVVVERVLEFVEQARGPFPTYSTKQRILDYPMKDAIADVIEKRISLENAAYDLGVMDEVARAILDPRFLQPYVEWETGHFHTGWQIRSIIKKLTGEAPKIHHASRDEVLLVRIFDRIGKDAFLKLLRLLYTGALHPAGVIAGERGIKGVVLGRSDIQTALKIADPPIPEFVEGVWDLAEHLKLTRDMVAKLVRLKVIKAMGVHVSENLRLRRRLVFRRDAIEEFRSRYVSLEELALRTHHSVQEIRARLYRVPQYPSRRPKFFLREPAERALHLLIGPPSPARLTTALAPIAPKRGAGWRWRQLTLELTERPKKQS